MLTEESGWGAKWGIELTPMSNREKHQAEYMAEVDDVLAGKEELATWDSGELVAPVIDSLVTGTRRECPLNRPNTGTVPRPSRRRRGGVDVRGRQRRNPGP